MISLILRTTTKYPKRCLSAVISYICSVYEEESDQGCRNNEKRLIICVEHALCTGGVLLFLQ